MYLKKIICCCKNFDFIEKILIIILDFILLILNYNWDYSIFRKSVVFFILFFLFLFSIVRIIKLVRIETKNVFHNNDSEGIKNYMKNWLNSNSRTVIVSRDMSWVSQNDEVYNILLKKAKDDELTIIVKNSKDIIRDLKNHGAEVYEYNNIDFTPSVRFTFIHYGLGNPRLAIGFKDHEFHKIKEFEKCGAIEYALAEDLFNLLKEVGINERSI